MDIIFDKCQLAIRTQIIYVHPTNRSQWRFRKGIKPPDTLIVLIARTTRRRANEITRILEIVTMRPITHTHTLSISCSHSSPLPNVHHQNELVELTHYVFYIHTRAQHHTASLTFKRKVVSRRNRRRDEEFVCILKCWGVVLYTRCLDECWWFRCVPEKAHAFDAQSDSIPHV